MPALNSYGAWRDKDTVMDWSAYQMLWFCIAVWTEQIPLSDIERLPYLSSAWYPGDAVARSILQEPLLQAKLLGQHVFDEIHNSFRRRKKVAQVRAKLSVLSKFLIWWFLPDTRLSIRTCSFLEIMLATCMSGKALTWLAGNSQTQHCRAILRVLPQAEAEAILFPSALQNPAWTQLVDRQRVLCEGCSTGLFGLYQLFSDN